MYSLGRIGEAIRKRFDLDRWHFGLVSRWRAAVRPKRPWRKAQIRLKEAVRLKPEFGAAFFRDYLRQLGSEPTHLMKLLEDLKKVGLPE